MWAAGQAFAAALRAQAPRRCAQRAPAQRLAAALAPTLCDVWGLRWASVGAAGGAVAPPDGADADRRLGGAGWQGGAGSGLGAAAARGLGGLAGGEAAQVAPPARKRRAPKVGKCGEKTADGRPKPDERTVAYLVALGWFAKEEEVVSVLTRAESQKHRYPFETAQPYIAHGDGGASACAGARGGAAAAGASGGAEGRRCRRRGRMARLRVGRMLQRLMRRHCAHILRSPAKLEREHADALAKPPKARERDAPGTGKPLPALLRRVACVCAFAAVRVTAALRQKTSP
jgi:hypothetical protein